MKWRLIESNIRNLQMNLYESLNGALGVLCVYTERTWNAFCSCYNLVCKGKSQNYCNAFVFDFNDRT